MNKKTQYTINIRPNEDLVINVYFDVSNLKLLHEFEEEIKEIYGVYPTPCDAKLNDFFISFDDISI